LALLAQETPKSKEEYTQNPEENGVELSLFHFKVIMLNNQQNQAIAIFVRQ
jgi:hypothetical protein